MGMKKVAMSACKSVLRTEMAKEIRWEFEWDFGLVLLTAKMMEAGWDLLTEIQRAIMSANK